MRPDRENGGVVSHLEDRFAIRSWDIDGTGRALPCTITNFLQEVAIRHAIELGLGREKLGEQRTWMLSRLRLEMERWPAWQDDVVVRTWPSDIDRLFALRDFELRDGAGDPLGAAVSAWLVVETKRRRPLRLPEEVKALRPDDVPRALAGAFAELPGIATPGGRAEFEVRWHDCDFNRHMNQTHYVAWALDLVPFEVLASSWLRSLEIEFRAEARPGDRVVSVWEGRGEGEFLHRLEHAEDGRELARLRSRWRPT
jgi:medium-chain acyl-[acyl-carrier-protein] hydrolase